MRPARERSIRGVYDRSFYTTRHTDSALRRPDSRTGYRRPARPTLRRRSVNRSISWCLLLPTSCATSPGHPYDGVPSPRCGPVRGNIRKQALPLAFPRDKACAFHILCGTTLIGALPPPHEPLTRSGTVTGAPVPPYCDFRVVCSGISSRLACLAALHRPAVL